MPLLALSFPDLTDFFHALGEELLAPFRCGVIPAVSGEAWRKTFHVGNPVLFVVGVLVTPAVSEGSHQPRGRIAQV